MKKTFEYVIVLVIVLLAIFFIIGNESKVVPVIENTPDQVENVEYIPTPCYSEGVEVECKG